jgi:thiamine biosynthesis protein ThiS
LEPAALQIVVNSEPCQAAEGTTVAQLLQQLGLGTKIVAVEVNLRLVPRAQHADCALRAGDRVEIVTLVGGG